MPTYSYRCRDCGVEFDIHQEFTDPALTACPQCAGSLRKLFSAVGVTFQGSGFYRTDSRASDKKAAKKSDPPASATPSSTPGSSTTTPSSPASSPSSTSAA